MKKFVIVSAILLSLYLGYVSKDVWLPVLHFYPNSKSGLKSAVERQYSLFYSGSKRDLARVYDYYLSPENKLKEGKSKEEFIDSFLRSLEDRNIVTVKYQIGDIYLRGNKGYVDINAKLCSDSSCEHHRISRGYREYIYSNGRWLMTDKYLSCPREKPYNIDPEFQRAINLIIQRTNVGEESGGFYEAIDDIKNCLYVRYAGNEDEFEDTEGFFRFSQNQSLDKLEIVVSPRYSVKDDLITATLLVHEITHAINFVYAQRQGEETQCVEDEASAFNNQNWFISLLNEEEKHSINARAINNPSPELQLIIDIWYSIPKFSGKTYLDKARMFVRSSEYYRKQCGL